MFVVDLALAPYRTAKLAVQVLGDLHEAAGRMRRGDDPFSQLRDAIRDGLADLDSVATKIDSLDRHLEGLDEDVTRVLHRLDPLIAALAELIVGGTDLTETAKELDVTAKAVLAGAASLEGTALQLDATATEITAGGRDLTDTAKSLDGHAAELIAGGQELTETARSLDGHSTVLIDGGLDLTETAKHLDGNAGQINDIGISLEASLQRVTKVLPQLLAALATVEELEEPLESVADTIKPLQKTAEKVGRVTERLSRK